MTFSRMNNHSILWSTSKSRAAQDGFTMLELLLTVFVFAGLLIAIFQVLEDLAEQELARGTSTYSERVGEAVAQTLTSDLNNFTAFYNDIQNRYDIAFSTTGHCAVAGNICAIEYSITPGDPVFNFIDGGLVNGVPIAPNPALGTGFSAFNPLKSPITVILTIANDVSAADPIPALHILIASEAPANDDVVREAASFSGPSGGWARITPPAGTNVQLESAFGTWAFDTAAFRDLTIVAPATNWFDQINTTTPPNDRRSYYFYYQYVNFSDSSGDYMYRTPQNNTELHRMYSDINMGGNNILGADNIVVAGNVDIENQLIVQGSANIAGNLSVQGNLNGSGRMASASMRVSHLEPSTIAPTNINLSNADFGNAAFGLGGINGILTDGVLNADNLNVESGATITADAATLENGVDAETISLQRGTITDPVTGLEIPDPDTGIISLNGEFESTGFLGITSLSMSSAGDVDVRGQANIANLEVTTGFDTNSGEMEALQMSGDMDVEVNGDFSARDLSLQTIDLTDGNFGTCNLGCGTIPIP